MTTLRLLLSLIYLGIEPSFIDDKILFLLIGLVKLNRYVEFLFFFLFFFEDFFTSLISMTLLTTLKSLFIYYLPLIVVNSFAANGRI